MTSLYNATQLPREALVHCFAVAEAAIPANDPAFETPRILATMGQAASWARTCMSSTTSAPLTRDGMGQLHRASSLLTAAMQRALTHEHHAVHVFNGSSALYEIASFLIQREQLHAALPSLLFAIFAVENMLPLMTAAYLHWRTTLYVTAAMCYDELGGTQQACDMLHRCLARIDDLAAIDKAPEAVSAIYDCRMRLKVALFRRVTVLAIAKTPRDATKPGRAAVDTVPYTRVHAEKHLAKLFGADLDMHMQAVLSAVHFQSERLFQSIQTPRQAPAEDVTAQCAVVNATLTTALLLIGRDLMLKQALVGAELFVTWDDIVRFLQCAVANKQWDVFSAVVSKLAPAGSAPPLPVTALTGSDAPRDPNTSRRSVAVVDKKRANSRSELTDAQTRIFLQGDASPHAAFAMELMRLLTALATERTSKGIVPTSYATDESKTTFSIPVKPRPVFPAELLPLEAQLRKASSLGSSRPVLDSRVNSRHLLQMQRA